MRMCVCMHVCLMKTYEQGKLSDACFKLKKVCMCAYVCVCVCVYACVFDAKLRARQAIGCVAQTQEGIYGSVYKCTCAYVCVYVHMYVRTYVCVCTYICTSQTISTRRLAYTRKGVFLFICGMYVIYKCIYIYIYIYIFIRMCVYVRIYVRARQYPSNAWLIPKKEFFCLYVCMYVIYKCMYIYIYIIIRMCVYVRIYVRARQSIRR